ncbi:MAG: tetratricopeptide repeat protein [bacterium]|nr:tetratricopeptide repeat protein [bacterium]
MKMTLWSCGLAVCAVTAGCEVGTRRAGYETLSEPQARNALLAQQLNDRGLVHVEQGDWESAEQTFREALEADLFYPAAHNNLALCLVHEKRFYEASWEFTWASKLAPHSAEPRNNLGLVLEQVGRLDQARDCYEQALGIDPDNIEVMGHLARVYVKSGEEDGKLHELLEELALGGNEQGWDVWARSQLLRIGE